ncbi:hypothetical protein CUJ84_Chr002879 [Rhizobium leguminosarum]|uniref:Uncharacterized protein n=1 Tax=Rhizobium leguminosarum TaxID=384 RepID=A0A2K9Z4Q4_RHILE|nr:hypothetical protein CUJ84_Chr002879 [Rhizobium leguminosarum]
MDHKPNTALNHRGGGPPRRLRGSLIAEQDPDDVDFDFRADYLVFGDDCGIGRSIPAHSIEDGAGFAVGTA